MQEYKPEIIYQTLKVNVLESNDLPAHKEFFSIVQMQENIYWIVHDLEFNKRDIKAITHRLTTRMMMGITEQEAKDKANYLLEELIKKYPDKYKLE